MVILGSWPVSRLPPGSDEGTDDDVGRLV